MLCVKPIVCATCGYLSLMYGIFYMSFETYPTVFQQIYKTSSGISGLMLLSICAGAALTTVIFIYYDARLGKAKLQDKAWSQRSSKTPTSRLAEHFLSLRCSG